MPSVVLQRSFTPAFGLPSKPKDVGALLTSNRLLPALRLCPDLLENLFLITVTLERDPYQRRRAALSYTQVCHDWRVAALSIKSLWAPLADFDFMPWVWNEEMLRRSFPLPVKMGVCTFPPRDTTAVEAELGHLGRIRTYRLGFTSDTWNSLVDKLQYPAEEMEYLSLAHVSLGSGTHSSRAYPSSSINSERFVLPPTLFSGYAPQIRRLKLEGCFIDGRAPILSSLTSLMVLDIDTKYNTAPTPQGWISLLTGMPSLTELFLKNAVASPHSVLVPARRRRSSSATSSSSVSSTSSRLGTAQTQSDIAILPNLTHLYLEGPLTEVAAMLARIDTPEDCDMTIACKECQVGEQLESVQRAWVKAMARALEARDVKLSQTNDMETSTSFPLLVYACGSTLSLCTDDRAFRHAWATINTPLPSSRHYRSKSNPKFYLDLHAPQGEQWEPFLPPILSTLSDFSVIKDVVKTSTSPLVSRITSLELILPSPHLDLVPFLMKADSVEALVNLPGCFGAWLLEELRVWSSRDQELNGIATGVGQGRDGDWGNDANQNASDASDLSAFGVGLTSSPGASGSVAQRRNLLPRLQALSFSDDRCLYGTSWASLKSFTESRLIMTSHITEKDHDRVTSSDLQGGSMDVASRLPSSSPRWSRDFYDRKSVIRRIAFRKCFAPQDRVLILQELGVAVECEVHRVSKRDI